MKKSFLIEFTTHAMPLTCQWQYGHVSSANYYAETEQEAIEFFRQDFGGVAVIEYCEEIAVDEEDHDYDDSMDGDAGSALASAGWGTDEDYGFADEVL